MGTMKTPQLPDNIGLQIRVTAFTNAVKTIKSLGGNIHRINIMHNGKCIAHVNAVDNLTIDSLVKLYSQGYWLELQL